MAAGDYLGSRGKVSPYLEETSSSPKPIQDAAYEPISHVNAAALPHVDLGWIAISYE